MRAKKTPDPGVIEIRKPDPDSQYRLRPCRRCKSDDASYVHYDSRGGTAWRVVCESCGYTVDKGCRVRHDAQLAWNEVCNETKKI